MIEGKDLVRWGNIFVVSYPHLFLECLVAFYQYLLIPFMMLNVWTIDLCRIWVAPPAHSLVVRWYVHMARVIKIMGNSVGVWVWDYGKPKRENKKVCINGYLCIHAFYWFWYFLILMKCLCLICCIALWIFLFVLAELWLITYIRVVGTKGKHVPDACWDVGVLLGWVLEGVGIESNRSIIIFCFMISGLCYFKIHNLKFLQIEFSLRKTVSSILNLKLKFIKIPYVK